ncbi:hypothetical protein [Collinsella ihumii]|uniref:hypothetical protein n=1 Tax=Collinsella ihumii TaxID=1720204 RepID=UPI000B0732B5|nr:hypothetical protein [Collinsella ihumii]
MSEPTIKPDDQQQNEQAQTAEATDDKRKLTPEELDDVTGGVRLPSRHPVSPYL